jgi:hypothetical protein
MNQKVKDAMIKTGEKVKEREKNNIKPIGEEVTSENGDKFIIYINYFNSFIILHEVVKECHV